MSIPWNSANADHLLRRAGFGATASETQKVLTGSGHPDDGISGAMQLAITLLKSNLGFRFIHLGIGGFDTRSDENKGDYHLYLLKTISDAISAGQADRVANGIDQDTVMVLNSEFGRTVYENGSDGTDHGTVLPVVVAGTPVQGRIKSPHPSLDPGALSPDGELNRVVDFRDVYANIVTNWMQLDATQVFPGFAAQNLQLF